MQFYRLILILFAALGLLGGCSKSSEVEEAEPVEVETVDSLVVDPNAEPTAICLNYENNIIIAVKENGLPASSLFYPKESDLSARLSGTGWPISLVANTLDGLFHNPALGMPLMALNVAKDAAATYDLPAGMQPGCVLGDTYAYGVDYSLAGVYGPALIRNYELAYSRATPANNCYFQLGSPTKFILRNTCTGQEVEFSFGPDLSYIKDRMADSGMTPEEINDLLVDLSNGKVTAAAFWLLVERIVPHYPGLSAYMDGCWKITAAYLGMEFDTPVQCAVRYAICGEAAVGLLPQ